MRKLSGPATLENQWIEGQSELGGAFASCNRGPVHAFWCVDGAETSTSPLHDGNNKGL